MSVFKLLTLPKELNAVKFTIFYWIHTKNRKTSNYARGVFKYAFTMYKSHDSLC